MNEKRSFECVNSSKRERIQEQTVNVEPKTVNRNRIASSDSELGANTFDESLILAQDERWRRA